MNRDRIDSLLARVDRLIEGCMGCGETVPSWGPSDVFCSEHCQTVSLRRMGDHPEDPHRWASLLREQWATARMLAEYDEAVARPVTARRGALRFPVPPVGTLDTQITVEVGPGLAAVEEQLRYMDGESAAANGARLVGAQAITMQRLDVDGQPVGEPVDLSGQDTAIEINSNHWSAWQRGPYTREPSECYTEGTTQPPTRFPVPRQAREFAELYDRTGPFTDPA